MARTPPSLSSLEEQSSKILRLISLLSRVNCSVERSLDAVATKSLSASLARCRTSSSLIWLVSQDKNRATSLGARYLLVRSPNILLRAVCEAIMR